MIVFIFSQFIIKSKKRPVCRRALSFIDAEAEGSSDDDDDDESDVPTQEDLDFIDDSELEEDEEFLALIAAARK